MRISYSALETYKTCPLKYKFQEIEKIKTPKSKEAVFGTILHSTLNFIYTPSLLPPTLEQALDYFSRNWNSDVFENELEERSAFSQGVSMVQDYYKKNDPAKVNIVDLESRFQIEIGEDDNKHIVSGIIDRIDKTEEGYEIIDYKTTKKMPAQEKVKNDLQLSVYHLGVANRWPSIIKENRPIKVSLYFLKHGEKLSSIRTNIQLEETKENIIKNLESIVRSHKEEKFDARPNVLCDWCEYQRRCPFFKHKFKEEKIFFNDQDIKALLNEFSSLKEDIDQKDKRIDEIKANLGQFMDQEGMERLFGDNANLTRSVIQRFKYDSETLRAILEPLGRWQDVLKVDDVKLKKVVKELPPDKQTKIEEARKVDKEYKTLALKKEKKKK